MARTVGSTISSMARRAMSGVITGAGEYAPMPPVLGPRSPSKARLWSCAEASAIAVSPSQSAKKEASSPCKNSSTTTCAPAAPNPPANIMSMASSASARVAAITTPLPAHVALRRRGRVEALVGGGGNLVGLAQILGEALGAFELRGRPARAEGLDAGRGEIVHDAGAERRLGSDHDQIDSLRLAESDHRRVVGDVERHHLAVVGDAGVARRAEEPRDQRARRDLPGERMLASARAEEEDVHARSAGALVFGAWCSMARLHRKAQEAETGLLRSTDRC